jgi:flagellar basal-body rod protein FlgB
MSDITAVSGSTTSELVTLALNAATNRHMAIAQNIANVNNEGYRPLQVDFERQVAMFKQQLLDPGRDAGSARAFDALRNATQISEVPDTAAKVQLDVEVAKMVQNTMYYQALLTARSKLSSLVRMAISGGR